MNVIQSVLQTRLLVIDLCLGTGKGYFVKVLFKKILKLRFDLNQ